MKNCLFAVLFFVSSSLFAAAAPQYKSNCFSLIEPLCHRLQQIWYEGNNELYLSGYTWHNRYYYSRENINSYNEAAWGGGWGKGFFDEDGDFHGLSLIAFLDSHTRVEPVAGYSFLKIKSFTPNLKAGIGYTAFLTSRQDSLNGIPFPGLLPLGSIMFKKMAVNAIYIPGFAKKGNVMYLNFKYTFS